MASKRTNKTGSKAVTLKKRGRLWCAIRVGTHVLHGPAWCLGLAEPK